MSFAVTTTDPTNTGVSTTSSSSLTGSNAADLQSSFLTLLVAQLKNQDPTNPMENNELTSQLAQISTVSGIEKLNLCRDRRLKRARSRIILQPYKGGRADKIGDLFIDFHVIISFDFCPRRGMSFDFL